jgi:hypothetical protein
MHSGSKLTGVVCKCIPCAKQRQQALDREARLRYRDEYNEWQELVDNAERALDEAQFILSDVKAEQRLFFNKVRKEINAERP